MSVSNCICPSQEAWFRTKLAEAPTDKALIVATHYAPYCFDHSDNLGIRKCIKKGISATGRTPDLVIAGHSHTYQRMTAPEGYPVVVAGTGGVSTSGLSFTSKGGAKQILLCNTVYGALTLTVDANPGNRKISGHFIVADSTSHDHQKGDVLDSFSYDW
ncbi:MAG: hypothetical protein QNJ09_10035 [Paracoccaceae bacterium]|nr:hypothetical protein [Paracoccaceae bacterium]